MTDKDSDQPVHPPSMARTLVYSSLNDFEAVEGNAISKYSDQSVQIHGLI